MKRPWYLSTWLIIIVVFNLLSVIGSTIESSALKVALPNLPGWYLPLAAVLGISEIVGAVMIWQWRKSGFYLIIGVAIISAFVSVVYTRSYGSIIFGALGILILYLCMRPVWKNFK